MMRVRMASPNLYRVRNSTYHVARAHDSADYGVVQERIGHSEYSNNFSSPNGALERVDDMGAAMDSAPKLPPGDMDNISVVSMGRRQDGVISRPIVIEVKIEELGKAKPE